MESHIDINQNSIAMLDDIDLVSKKMSDQIESKRKLTETLAKIESLTPYNKLYIDLNSSGSPTR